MSRYKLIPRLEIINGQESRCIGPADTSFGRTVYLANPEDRDYADKKRHVFAFGGFSWPGADYVMAWGTWEDAFDLACEYAAERWPGLVADDSVQETYDEYVAEKGWNADDMTDEQREEAYEYAEADTFTFGNASEHMHSEDAHHVCSDPTRNKLVALCYPTGLSWRGEGTRVDRFPQYRPDRYDHDPEYHERNFRAAWRDAQHDVFDAIEARSEQGRNRIQRAMLGYYFEVGGVGFAGCS